MKQYHITSSDILQPSDDDCYLAPDDPTWELMKVSQLGGLGSQEALAKYNAQSAPKILGTDKGKIARELGLQPGTPEWFKHWFRQ